MGGNKRKTCFQPDCEGYLNTCRGVALPFWQLKYASIRTRVHMVLKEQYPVTAHAPNFDFWTGCREIKRCEESKRTSKNPFASRLVEFNTTLELLRISDKWYIVPVKFRLGKIWIFWRSFYCRWRRTKSLEVLWCRLEAFFLLLASIQAQIIVKGMHRNKTATIRL